mmetsp:Transcript_28039/g.58953  ORF Transcript_28039/g.58953 Transcript_28039/m.58953 type:complete len:348 (-) Transcript_28039:199-1242(-)
MAVRNGRFSGDLQHPLAESTVRNSISYVAQTFRDHGERNPTKDEDGETSRLLQRLFRGLKNDDPNKRQQKALPVCVLRELAKRKFTEHETAVKQLAIGAFFFACRSCEYLLVPAAHTRRTTTLTLGNIRFFRQGAPLAHTQHDLDTADCVNLTFVFQKKDQKHDSVSQRASGDAVMCPVKQWAALVQRIHNYPGTSDNTTVDTIMSLGRFRRITSTEMVHALRDAAAAVGEARLGFAKEDIGTHSLRSGAAMSMYLGECPVYTIMMIGRWSSDAFLLYIRKQVEQFSHNVATKMLAFETYNHIPDYNPSIARVDPRTRNHADNAATRRNIGGDTAAQARLPAFALHY